MYVAKSHNIQKWFKATIYYLRKRTDTFQEKNTDFPHILLNVNIIFKFNARIWENLHNII